MRQRSYIGGSKVEWSDVPAFTIGDDREAPVQPLTVTRMSRRRHYHPEHL